MSTKRIQALEARRDAIKRQMDELDDQQIERKAPLSDAEQATYDAHAEDLETVIRDLDAAQKREASVQRSLAQGQELGVGSKPSVVVTRDEPIYRADAPHNFFADLVARQRNNDLDASQRLGEWNKISRAAATSSELAGLVVPEYITNELIGLAREGRPFLNTLRSRPVRGMTAILPRVVTSPITGAQATENTAFATAALDTEEVSVATNTVAGYTDISVQALDFGAIDEAFVMGELLSDLYTRMDYLALWGSGSNNEPEGLFNADNTNVIQGDAFSGSAADKFGELYAVVRQGAGLIRVNDHRAATHVLMSGNRWYSISSALDSEGRPLLGWADSAPQNVGGTWTGPSFAGLRCVDDENVVKLTEDDTAMAVYHAPAIWFAESEPKRLVCECVVGHTGGVRFILRAYMQFTAEHRPKAVTLVEDLPIPEYPTQGGLS